MIDKNVIQPRTTLVEEGTQFKGSLSSDCSIEVKGRIEGDVTAPTLTVRATGAVHGRVRVGTIHSEGELAGEFDADMVHLSGTVKDRTVIRAKSLEVKLAPPSGKLQVVFGECELEVGGEQPPKEAAARRSERPKTVTVRPPPIEIVPATSDPAPPAADANGAA